ncbi:MULTISPECIES: plasmid replication protein RepC [unclassified Ochrobactrum]|uniref:plasmid replication protein RepC n=1 Tax=unclassified Ochrobactrum TaxID=239106 RepID=UPI000DEFFBAF|nr:MULTISPECIES: plasmid replication protein RepC [unclassified Ochrobactrum]MBQ0710310.1 replication initiation protein RepC [Ochrobactrum sp. AP1BH01-1]
MEIQLASTPFGSRRMTLALLASQQNTRQIAPGTVADKWQLHRWLCEAKTLFGLNDRSLAVLSALLSFYPETELNEQSSLIVFPSNKQLALRAHGMADATLRRHLAALVDGGFILRQDSPNGKRYARRAKGGDVQIAFGFSLAPLLARACELETAAEQVRAEKTALREMRERLTLLRRDITKLVEFAAEEKLAGDWQNIGQRFRLIVDSIPRRAEHEELAALVNSLQDIRAEIDNALKIHENVENLRANESQNERQQIESNPDSHLERATPEFIDQRVNEITSAPAEPMVSLDMVLRSCPEITAYAVSSIRHWHDLANTAEKVRSFLGIDGKLYDLAKKVLGTHNASIVIAYILQRYEQIQSAGGYLRILTEKAAGGSFSIRPMLMAALNAQNRC